MNIKSWNFWQKIMTVTFWLGFMFIVVYFYLNIEAIKNNPCSYCSQKYGLTCTSYERNLIIEPPNGTQRPLNTAPLNRQNTNLKVNLSELTETLSIKGTSPEIK